MSTLVVQTIIPDLPVDRTGFVMATPSIVGLVSLAPALPYGFYVQYNSGGTTTTNPVRIMRPDGSWGFVVDITGRFIFSGGVWIPLGP